MRVYTNHQRIKNNRRVAQILFFISLIVLIGGLVLTNLIPPTSTLLLFVPCLVMPIGLGTTWISVRLTNQFIREPHPEDAILAGVKSVGQGSVLYNYLFKSNHVLVSPEGVFTFMTRFQQGPIKVDGIRVKDFRANDPLGKIFTYLRQEQLGDIYKLAEVEATEIQLLVSDVAPDVEVSPVVVFINPRIRIEIIEPELPIVVAAALKHDKRVPTLKSLMREARKQGTLSTDQVEAIQKRLNQELAIAETGQEQTITTEDEEE